METTQISVPDPPDQRLDLLTEDTVQQIRFLFDVDHAFPQMLQQGDQPSVTRSKGLLGRFFGRMFGWIVSGCKSRRRNLAARFRTPPTAETGGE